MTQSEHVGVALDDVGTVGLGDRRPGLVKPVEQVALSEELAFRRVDVLGPQRVVLPELPRLEAEDAAAGVGEREDQPLGEVVAAPAVDEARREQLLDGESLRPSGPPQRRATEREPEPELAADLLPETAPGQVVARAAARRGRPEIVLVERRRADEQLEQALSPTALGVLAGRRLLVLEHDVEAVGERLDRPDEVQLLRLLDEADRVAARAAAEAVVGPLRGTDREARRPLLVKRAAPHVPGARFSELRTGRHHFDDAGRRLHGVDGRLLDSRHYGSSAA